MIEINELKRQLKEEKEKNLKLINENNNLKKILNKLNNELNKIKGIKQKLEDNDLFDMNSLNSYDKKIDVNFVNMENIDMGNVNLKCKINDLFVRLEETLYNDFPDFKQYETYFEVNGKKVKRFQTLEQNGIKNNDK